MNPDPIRILAVERDGDDGVIVTFSDGITDAYVAEELLEIRPYREPTAIKVVVSIDSKMNHFEDPVEAFFHGLYANGKLDDEQMARIAESIPASPSEGTSKESRLRVRFRYGH